MNTPRPFSAGSSVRFQPEAILFDLDGTLLDTISDLAEAVNHMLEELGRPHRPLAEIQRFVGKGMPDLIRRCLTENSTATPEQIDAALPVFRRHYTAVNGNTARLYPGMIETLTTLRKNGLKLAVVTNKGTSFTHTLLERMALTPYFAAVVCGDTLSTRKPDPAMLEHACALLEVSPEASLMIGDSINDAQAARAARIPVFLVRYGYSEGCPVDTIECDGLLSGALELIDRIHLAPC